MENVNYDALYIDAFIKHVGEKALAEGLNSCPLIEAAIIKEVGCENFMRVPNQNSAVPRLTLTYFRKIFPRGMPIVKNDITSRYIIYREIAYRTMTAGLRKCRVVVSEHIHRADPTKPFYTFYIER